MLEYTSIVKKGILHDRLDRLRFLIGNFKVTAYDSVSSKGWFKTGYGSANFSLEDTFIKEKVNITRGTDIIRMENTIGCDIEKNSFKMQTLDINSGVMDIYRGFLIDRVLTFNNIDSGIRTKNEYDEWFSFKLIYKQISPSENELIIGCSKDNGKTWFPFLKNYYKKK